MLPALSLADGACLLIMAQIHAAPGPAAAPPSSVWTTRSCAVLAAASAIWVVLRTTTDTLWLYHPLPFGDYWDFLGHLMSYLAGEMRPSDLWDQHNEHRILFPRLVFLADAQWFGLNNWFTIGVTCLLQVLHAVLVVVLVLRVMPERGAARVVVAATVAACMLHGSQLINLAWSFQVQFVMVYVAITAALHELSRHDRGARHIVAAIAAGCIATGSMANGVLVWPLLWSLAVQRRVPLRWILILVAAGAAMLFAYLHGYKNPAQQHSPLLESAIHPLATLQYLCAFLGNPLWPDTVPAVTAGAITLLLATWTAVRLLRRWSRLTPAEAVLLHVIFLVVGTGLMISAGRLNSPLEAMLNSRYCTPALLLWSVLLATALPQVLRSGPWRTAGLMAFALGLALLAPRYLRWTEPMAVWQADATSCLMAGVMDEECMGKLCSASPVHVQLFSNALRAHRLSVYGSGLQYLMGDDLLDHFELGRADLANAGITQPEPVPGHPGASRCEGWAYHAQTGMPADLLLAVDERWRIVGMGSCSYRRRGVATAGHLRNDRVGCRVWIREADHPGREVTIYAVWAGVAVPIHGPLCKAEAVAERALSDDFQSIGLAAGVQDPQISGWWSPSVWPGGMPAPPLPEGAVGSWCGDDSRVGSCRISIPARTEDAVLLVPLLTGPDARGVLLRIYDPRTDGTQARLRSPTAFPDRWRLWRVPLPARTDGGHWVLEADDRGRGWGQWFAMSAPHWERAAR